MSKKLKNWLTVALGLGITAKGVYDLLNDEEEDTEIVKETEVTTLADNRGKSKYVDMSVEEVEIVEEDANKEEKND
jgi:hypothetical protein